MSEKSEVQNLTEATTATEPLDAGPPAADVNHVQHGEPKAYPDDDQGDDDPYRAKEQHDS